MGCEEKKVSFWRKWVPVLVLALGLAIIIIDTTLLNVSLGNVIRDLNTDIQKIQWVITAYSLTLAALTITGGRLGDLLGRKRMFVAGAIIFAVGSYIASISRNVGTMIAGESIIEGIGAALMMPATASLLVSTYKGRERAIAMGIWGGVAGAASAVGPILGGYLTTHFSWRWGFRINIVVALLLVLGSIIIKECRDEEEKPGLDIPGVILSSTGMLAMVFGIIESSTYGWWKAKEAFISFGHALNLGGYSIVPLSLLIGLILLISFVVWEIETAKRGNTPLVSMTLFKNQQFVSSVGITMIMALAQAGLIFSIPIFLQSVRGLDAFETGMAFLPMSIAALIFAPMSAFFSNKIAPKRLIQIGFISMVAGIAFIYKTLNVDSTSQDLVPGMIFYGIGMGLMMAQINNMALSAVSIQEAGEASGVNNTLRQIGATLGAAVIGAALLTALSTNLIDGINGSKVIPDKAKAQISTEVSSQTSNVEFGGGARIGQNIPQKITDEITLISHKATTDSNKMALLYTFFATIVGFLATFFLPRQKNLEVERSATK